MLEVKNLTVRYGKVEAAKGICMRVAKGEFVSLIGANGAGKTTIMRTISGLNKPVHGEIKFEGENIEGLAPERIAHMGIVQVPEGRRIFPHLTVTENLLVGAYLTKDKREKSHRLERVFEWFPRLSERRKQLGGTMSGGEQQMLAFGRALMANPRLLLLDEPTLGLAPIMVKECAKFALKVHEEGLAIILVEQNARLALSISQRAYVMETGSIVLDCASRELLDSEHVKKAYLGA